MPTHDLYRPGQWYSLPPELATMVLENLHRQQRKKGLSSYVRVCKQWQYVLEKENFRRLKLRASCLESFEEVVSPRVRDLVRHVWLNVKLLSYEDKTNWQFSTTEEDSMMEKAVGKLLAVLKTWRSTGNGLTLELTAQSPTDQLWYRHLHYGAHGEEEGEGIDAKMSGHDTDVCHDGQQQSLRRHQPLMRIHAPIYLLPKELPQVDAVTRILLRRQFRRQFSYCSMNNLLASLPRLECLVYEPWSALWHHSSWRHAHTNNDLGPKTLKRLSLFENRHEVIDPIVSGVGSHHFIGNIFHKPASSSDAVVRRSSSLEHLSVAFMIEAQHFFHKCRAQQRWERLESLVLTSTLLGPAMDAALITTVSGVLVAAGAAALRTPNLRTMAIWNAGVDFAGVFLYQRDSKASIS
ncbi:hypothetical protein C8035_v011281 [Colletotrichum spinosum]|uniref:DUF6546 domain-containing protein n=1 Tax=Colletotrichum spinosum TaxID=1347390 RepID=A0A4R8Q6H1_9PEZI|nr:hypothetical protein C8035_v011281 [Colletotrichum spinosum]